MSIRFRTRLNSLSSFYIALGIFYIRFIISQTTLADVSGMSMVMRLMLWSVYALLFMKFITQRYSMRSLIIAGVTGVLILLSSYLTGSRDLLYTYLFVVSAKDVDLKKAAREFMIITLLMVFLIMIMANAGMIESITQEVTDSSREYFWSGGDTLKLWGFKHHNYLGSKALNLSMCYVFLRYEDFKWYDLVPNCLMFYFCYYLVKCRTAALLIVICILMVLLFKFLKFFGDRKKKDMAMLGVSFLMGFSVIFSFAMCIMYNSGNRFHLLLNSVLTNRLTHANSLFAGYGFSVFGQHLELVSSVSAAELGVPSVILDNAYMHLFIRFGMILGVLVILGYFMAARVAIKGRIYAMLVIIAVIFLCGISETWFHKISDNPFVLLLAIGMFNQDMMPAGQGTAVKRQI